MDWLGWTEVGIALVVLCILIPLVWLFARRRWLSRHGAAVDAAFRDAEKQTSWRLGIARYHEDALEWFPAFSLRWRPRIRVTQVEWESSGQRPPTESEAMDLYEGQCIVTLRRRDRSERVELALATDAATGLRSWLEAAPAGSGGYGRTGRHPGPGPR